MNTIEIKIKPPPVTPHQHRINTAVTPQEHQISTYLNHIRSMSRSIKKSIAIPQPVRDALNGQIENGVLDYPSENAAWIGLARYQLLIGKPHPVTAAIALMHQRHQDLIDDFLHAIATNGIGLRGQFLSRLIRQALSGESQPNEQEVQALVPQELLKMAKEWKRNPEKVLTRLSGKAEMA
jgi:hypothetical protein